MFQFFLSFLRNIKSALGNFLVVIYGFIPDNMKSRFKELSSQGAFSAMVFFVLNIFKNIYFLIAIPALIVSYRFIKILQEKGIIDEFQNIVSKTINSVLYISTNCFPLILDLGSMASCINHS